MSHLNSDLKFIFIMVVFSVISLFLIASYHNDKIYKREKEEREYKERMKENTKQDNTKNKPNNEPKNSSIIDTLDWMLAKGIIDSKEYTKLMGKCLPFL